MKKIVILKQMLFVVILIGVLGLVLFNFSGCEHKHSYTPVVTEPTCTEKGYTTYTCECGDIYNSDYVNAVGHNYRRDYTFMPWCYAEGYTQYKCIVCGDTFRGDYVDPVGHNYTAVVTEPTTTSQGYTTYTCGRCLNSYVTNWKDIIPTYLLVFNDDEQNFSVTGIGTCTDIEIVIISKYNYIPVISIGDMAFYNCQSFTSMIISDGITLIGEGAFYNCTSLATITIPKSITNISPYAFYDCNSLSSIIFEGTVDEWNAIEKGDAWNFNTGSYTIYCTNGEMSKDGVVTYRHSKGLELTLNSDGQSYSVTGIGTSSDVEIVIPSICNELPVTNISSYAFNDCYSLTSIIFEGTVDEWNAIEKGEDWDLNTGSYTIYCSDAEISKDGIVTYYPSKGLELTLNSDGQSYSVTGKGSCTDVKIVIPGTYNELPVTNIGYSAFENCTSLVTVLIPNSVSDIGNKAFYGCTSLASIEIPASVTSIGSRAFYGCSSLTSIIIPESVNVIGTYAFTNCSSLTIYCEREEENKGSYLSEWNGGRPVVWGYTGK